MKILMQAALVVLGIVSVGYGDPVQWLGNSDNWETPGNWSSNAVPGTNGLVDDVIIDGDTALFAPKLYYGAIVDAELLTLKGKSFTIDGLQGIIGVRSGLLSEGPLKLFVPEVMVSYGVVSGNLAFSSLGASPDVTLDIAPDETMSARELYLSCERPDYHTNILGQLSDLANTRIHIGIWDGSGTFAPGQSFDFTTGNFQSAQLAQLPILPPSMSWDVSRFEDEGVLTIVPEPNAATLLLFGSPLFLFARRRVAANRQTCAL